MQRMIKVVKFKNSILVLSLDFQARKKIEIWLILTVTTNVFLYFPISKYNYNERNAKRNVNK